MTPSDTSALDYLKTLKPELKRLAGEGDVLAQAELDRRKARRAAESAEAPLPAMAPQVETATRRVLHEEFIRRAAVGVALLKPHFDIEKLSTGNLQSIGAACQAEMNRRAAPSDAGHAPPPAVPSPSPSTASVPLG